METNEDVIIHQAQEEAKSLRLFVNPMNLLDVFPEDVKPLSKKSCIYCHCLNGAKYKIFSEFIDRSCNFLVVNNILTRDPIEIKVRDIHKHKLWYFDTSKGDWARSYDFLTCLEYYMIFHPEKTKDILDYVKSVTDTLTLKTTS